MRLDILQVNELNFDLVEKYIANGESLPALERIIQSMKKTKSEKP